MLWSRIIDSISGRFAFFPPTPPSYTLEPHGDGQRELSINPIVQRGHHKVSRAQVFQLPIPNNRNGDTIVAAYIAAPSPVRFTLLHSHGNAVDLGQMLPLYEQLSILLKVNVFAYDYRGYGQSSGLPAVSATLVDISTALQFLLDHFHVVPQDVVLYGQSVGSGPSSWLAARTPGLGGLVLHSPFMSGLRVLRPTATRWPSWADIYTNYKTLPKVSCRTLIMHGTLDEIIDISHAQELHSLCQNSSEPLWAEGRCHQTVEADPHFLPALRRFLSEVFGEEYSKQFSGKL